MIRKNSLLSYIWFSSIVGVVLAIAGELSYRHANPAIVIGLTILGCALAAVDLVWTYLPKVRRRLRREP